MSPLAVAALLSPRAYGLVVLDAAHHVNILCAQCAHEFGCLGRRDDLDEHVGGHIAALGDHQAHELPDGQPLADSPVKPGFGIIGGLKGEMAAVDDADEVVLHSDPVIETKVLFLGLPENFHHDRHLDRAGRMEVHVALKEHFFVRGEIRERKGDIGSLDIADQGADRSGHVFGRRRDRCRVVRGVGREGLESKGEKRARLAQENSTAAHHFRHLFC